MTDKDEKEKPVMENKRRRQIRNLFSAPPFDRRKKPGGYPAEVVCPNCGRAVVTGGQLCGDCKREKEGIKWDKE